MCDEGCQCDEGWVCDEDIRFTRYIRVGYAMFLVRLGFFLHFSKQMHSFHLGK